MPRIETIKFYIQLANSSEFEPYRAEDGITYREALEDEAGVNPAKFTALVDGHDVDLDDEVQPNDRIVLQTKKYSSGC